MAAGTAPHHHSSSSGSSCGCPAHTVSAGGSSGLWSLALPILACALCPACLATYAKLFSVLGVGVGLEEAHHEVILAAAIAVSVVLSAWRSLRSRRVWPLGVARSWATLIGAGHLAGEDAALEWLGMLALLAGGLSEHFRLRPRAAATGTT